MRLRRELSEGELRRGFDKNLDLFKRKELALRLTGMFEVIEHGSVCLLDGRWGSGKSTFVKQWLNELGKLNIPAIYFDAFASDYLESPFEAIAGAFVQAARAAERSDQPAYHRFLSRAANVGRTIASVSAKVGVKAATLGAVSATDLKELGELKGAIADGFGDVTEQGVKKILEAHADRQAQFEELRKSLESLPNLLRPEQGSNQNGPLIVFIDELDRCRPDFALGILETLKHFFRADRLHFVLVTNKEHLHLSVDRRYGAGSASSEYLEKFYDFVVLFDNTYDRHKEGGVAPFVQKVLKDLPPVNLPDVNDIHDYVVDIVLAFRMTLRQIQTFAANVAIAYLASRDREFRPVVLVCFLVALKTRRPDLYRAAKAGSLDWKSFRDFVSAGHWERTNIDRVVKIFQFHLDENIDANSPEWEGYGRGIWNYNLERERVIPYLSSSVIDRFGVPAGPSA